MTHHSHGGASATGAFGSCPSRSLFSGPVGSLGLPSWTPESDADSDPAGSSSFGAGVEGAKSAPSDRPRRARRPARKPKAGTSDAPTDDHAGDDRPADAPSSSSRDDAEGAPPKKKRRSRKKAASKAKDAGDVDPDEPKGSSRDGAVPGESEEEAADRKRRRRGSRGGRRRKRDDENEGAATIDSIPGEDDDLETERPKRARKTRAKKATSGRGSSRRSESEDEDESDDGSTDEAGGKKRRRRRSRKKSKGQADDEERDEAAGDGDGQGDESDKKPRRKRTRSKKKPLEDSESDAAPKSRAKAKGKAKSKAKVKTDEEKAQEALALRTQTIAVNAVEPEERRVAVFEGDIILDFLMNAESQKTLVNDIYRGRVVNLEPAIGAAFIDFGQGRNGFLHTSDVLPLYGEDGFKLEDLLTAGLHHVEGDHDADWSEEADALEEDHDDEDDDEEEVLGGPRDDDELVAEEIAEIDDLDDPADEDSAEDNDDEDDDIDLEEEEEEEESSDSVEPDSPSPRRSRGRRSVRSNPSSSWTVDLPDGDPSFGSGAGGSDDSDGDESRGSKKPARKRRPRRSKKVTSDEATPDGDGGEPKPARRSSKKSKAAKAPRERGNAEEDGAAPDGEERRPRKKRSRRKASAAKAPEDDSADSDDEAPRGRGKKKSQRKKTSSKTKAASGRSTRKKGASKKSSAKGARGGAGGRGGRGRSERRPQRERRPIDQLLKVGDPVVVQITKDAIGDKGPTLTTYVSVPGRYLVLMPSMARTGVSRKIPDEKERKRLKRILSSMNTPPDMGVIVRTAGVGRTKTDLQRDLDYLMGLWESFGKKLKSSRGPAPLYLESDVATRTLRDLFNRETKEVLVDDVGVYEQMVSFAEALMPEHVERIRQYDGDRPLFQHCGIEQDFERIFSRRVDLKSGGSIVFDQAEALVAIDVNSGRTRTNSYDFEEIALKTNLEAVPEIARQIKLRDLGGIIVCDFIDMVRSNSNRSVEKLLRSELSSDRARSKLGRISQFGLLELTRQRLGPGTHKKVFQSCPRCRGTGRIRSVESRAQAILRRLGGALVQKGFSKVEVRAHPEVVKYLKEDLWDWVRAMEHRTEREIILTGVPDQAEDSVLRYLRADGREVRPGGRRKR